MTEDEFWDLTPRGFHALLERQAEAERREDARVAIATTHLLGPHLPRGARLTPADLYPSLRPAAPRAATTPAEIAARIRAAGRPHEG